jgi:hypothetical protein
MTGDNTSIEIDAIPRPRRALVQRDVEAIFAFRAEKVPGLVAGR